MKTTGRKNQANVRPGAGRFCGTVALVFLATSILAQTNDSEIRTYLPYLNGRPWPQVPTTKYVETVSNIWVHPTAPKKYPTVQEIADDDSDFATVIIRLPDGSVYKKSRRPTASD